MAKPDPQSTPTETIGRYVLCERIASGGMATVFLGRLVGATGFTRPVAIKRLHPHLSSEPRFLAMLLDEARLASRIRHPNVVPTLDVVEESGEFALVMEYVEGESLASLMRLGRERREPIPPNIAVAVVVAALHGLHAAHEALDQKGERLDIVHRDVSPQNILVGVDGIVRVADFGVAKAANRIYETKSGSLKGKAAYMAPEQVRSSSLVTRRADIYAAALVLWESLTGHRPFSEDDIAVILTEVLAKDIPAPSTLVPTIGAELDALVMKGLARDPNARFATALEMADALERIEPPASQREITAWLRSWAERSLEQRAAQLARVERSSDVSGAAVGRDVVRRMTGPSAQDEVPVETSTELLAPDRPPRRRRMRRGLFVVGVLGGAAIVGGLGGFLHRTVKTTEERTAPAGTASVATSGPSAANPPAEETPPRADVTETPSTAALGRSSDLPVATEAKPHARAPRSHPPAPVRSAAARPDPGAIPPVRK